MRYPEFLNNNGTIGFVAPSFGCSTEPYRSCFDSALDKFKKMGYKLDLAPNCYADEGVGISSTPQKCGAELTQYYCSENNDVLISCGGGELMCEILDFVDFEKVKAAVPKWFMGYSDNTNFTFLLTTLCDTASIYGPCASSFGMEVWHESLSDAFSVLQGKKLILSGYDLWEKESFRDEANPLVPYNTTEERILHTLPKDGIVDMSGRLLGGCMDCLVNLTGTEFDRVSEFAEKYKDDGIIWFLEVCDLNTMSIRRALWQMEHAGWFKYVKGFIFGRPLCFGESCCGLNQYDAVTGILSKYNVPIIMDADIGHLPPKMPLICGSFSSVRAAANDIRIDMKLV